MKNKIHFLFLLCFLIGCRKEKHEEEIKYIPQELKDYMYFKEGTWWVYEEESTHERDSVVVFYNDDSLITFDGSTGTPAGTYEYFDCKTHSSHDDYGYYYSCNTTWTRNERTPVWRDKTKPGDYVGTTIIMFDKFVVGVKLYPYTQNGIVTFINIYDSLYIQGNFYFNVIQYNDSKNSTENEDSTNFYISRNIGIIRKELISNNQIWNLVSYHIIK